MLNTANLRLLVAFTCLAASIAIAAPSRLSDDQMAARNRIARHGTLDENENQLRYSKTTDFGATWTLAQAGDLSTFAPTESSFPDFGAVVMANGELCYVITLATAATPGVYSLSGPAFTPVLVMAEGSNSFDRGYSSTPGHTDVSRAANGTLVCVIWGTNSSGESSLWASKSADNGATWATPWVLAAGAALGVDDAAEDGLFKMPDRCDNTWAWAQYQNTGAEGYDQYVVRFNHSTMAAGTVISLPEYSGHPYSYMFGGCKPIAYDAAANYLYLCFRNPDANGVSVYLSNDYGATFTSTANLILSTTRYPSMSVNPAAQYPWVVLGETVGSLQPGTPQCLFRAYDEGNYNGGAWTGLTQSFCTTLRDTNTTYYYALYIPHLWWWDANRGVMTSNTATNFLSGEVIETVRTTDGGATWVDFGTRVHYETDQINAGTMLVSELCGGENGVAYVALSGAPGVTDITPPTVTDMQLLTPATTLGPYVVKALYQDGNGIDTVTGPWVNWRPTVGGSDSYVTEDSVQYTVPGTLSGWYFFTIPDTATGGIQQGDSIFFYCDGYDVGGNYSNTETQIIIAGVEWLAVEEPMATQPTEFALHGNFPNPFNPETRIMFDLPANARIDLVVYNTLGQVVRVLANDKALGAGTHRVTFNANDLPSGIYLYRLSANGVSATRKMVLVK
ncbi:T9SS type A sorting domain-containing protein [candidate division KSB1 bacterium]|nr:T9SS type A sorting domain-containing protein [candidate division KSB1 bacterium]